MKKKVIWIVLLCAALLVAGFAALDWQKNKARLLVPISLGAERNSVSNNVQYNANTVLWRYEDVLYFYNASGMRGYEGWIVSVDGASVTKVFSLKKHSDVRIVGTSEGFLYYLVRTSREVSADRALYCFDTAAGSETKIATGDFSYRNTMYFAENGDVFVPFAEDTHTSEREFLRVHGSEPVEITKESGVYLLGGKAYSVHYAGLSSAEGIYCTEEDGRTYELSLDYAHGRSLIPYENGLLIHNSHAECVLYNVDALGEVSEIFSMPCLDSQSAVCVVGNTAYLSYDRYKEYGEIGMRHFENDTVPGTYKINLSDFSCEKISDMIFTGIYCLDDEALYAIRYDSQNGYNISIYRLDYDGSATPVFGRIG